MNFNAILAVLVLKNIISKDEGERIVEHLNQRPQSTVLSDAIAQITELMDAPAPPILPQVATMAGPVQQAENAAALAATPQAPAGAPMPDDKPAMPSDNNDSSVTSEQNTPKEEPKAPADDKPAKKPTDKSKKK